MAKKAKSPKKPRGGDDGEALIIRAPDGKLYFVNELEQFAISADEVSADDYPIDARKLQEGDFACWPCKRR
jgi:hypothetical protein